ncbi:protein-glutamate O-methyltransferase CheR [soil metagenome]|nr:protein-glutamate O-methyltransferase CheR [Gemmatimonadota bacterium]
MRSVALTDEEYRLFSEWLVEEFGLWFGPEKREILRTRLEPRRAELGMSTFQRLFFHLKFHPEREEERARLVPHLTNNESYFFRERPQLDAFREIVLPRLLAAQRLNPLRVLSAGCSAGQEPYTLAILLSEASLAPRLQARVTGVDLDPRILDQARGGRYTAHSFRGVDPELRDRYFGQTAGNEWEILPALREAVDFQRVNLSDPGWARAFPPQDVIFCRNVLIYFDPDALIRAARGLHDALAPGGYLFLGHAETLSRVSTPLIAERRPGAIFYRRPTSDGQE